MIVNSTPCYKKKLEVTLLLKLVICRVRLPYDIPHRLQAAEQAFQEAASSRIGSVELKLDIVLMMLVGVLHVTAPVLGAFFPAGPVFFVLSVAFLFVLLQLQHTVLEVALLSAGVLAERRAGRAAAAHAQLVVSAWLQGHGEAGRRGQVCDDLGRRGRWLGLGRRGTVGVGFLQSVAHYGELELFLELSHQ